MSSGGQLARNRALSLGSGRSSKGRNASMADFSMPDSKIARDFEPCDATASMFLYAQGNTVVCAHHDTLTIERRFSRHKEEVQILAVDNVSERGAGRLVISYDAGQTAIVWDLMTGDEVARFASYNTLSVAAWMRNGNVAFGNAQGNVILFEPSTSEHISARTIDQVPITAIAPAADCRTYAIGYQNGSLLIASLQPRFTILHNLTTSRAPSPIVTLAWHASSSRQKSDMLATQTHDGDLRVWSIAKSPSSNDSAKVVRVLKRSENSMPGPNWLAWSKNGRIIQYSEGETSSWDVRTKNVTYEIVPTLEHVRGIAIYGPGATLFTLGRSNTAQQFDLNSPPVLVANVQHPANLLPPSPPVSIEEQKKGLASNASSLSEIPINVDVSESDEDHMSPLARIAREMDKLEERQQYGPDRSGALSPVSSQASSTSRSSAGSRPFRRHGHGSVLSKGYSDHTLMSPGSSMHSKEPSISSRDSYSVSSMSSSSQISGRSRPRPSRLRQEVIRSPEEKVIVDLFKFTKSRLSDIPYAHPQVLNNKNMTHNDLRRQMLNTIFGWNGEAEDLVRDELNRHPMGSPNRLLLTKWLGDIDTDIMASSSESMTASDWMLLALSGIGGQTSQQKVARAYVQRLLEKGDVHTAATIMIGMGDQNDAIEIYVSHRRYMEALILTCMVYPADWGRQTQLLRKWGEWAVQHSQQQLAIRCFSCTGSEISEPLASPNAQTITFSPSQSSIPEMLSPPLSPPGVVPRGPQRNMAKTAALKLVTSFGDKNSKSKFFGADDERTPLGGIGTPIADSALSPSGDSGTAFLRPGQRSVFNTPASARTATPGGYTRQRLPSIGEMPTDVTPIIKMPTVTMPTPRDQTANDAIALAHQRKSSQPETLQLSSAIYQPTRAATASPMMQRVPRVANPLPSPSPDTFTQIKAESRTRNGSRGRKPDGLQIQWPPMESIITGDYMTTPDLSTASARPTPTARSVAGSVSSISTGGRSYRSLGRAGDASPMTGRSLDPYISSLDAASHYAKQKAKQERQASRDKAKSSRGRSSSGTRKPREASLDRGRSGVPYIKPAKRSPTSPVPMSPEDLRDLGAVGFGDGPLETSSVTSDYKHRPRDGSQATARPGSKASSRIRRMSPEPLKFASDSRPASRLANRQASRRTSPDPSLRSKDGRGRSKARDGSVLRSPSSPLPMSTEAAKYRRDEDDMDDHKAARSDRERFRSRQRSTSRLRDKGPSRHASPERKHRDRSTSRAPTGRASTRPEDESRRKAGNPSHTWSLSDLKAGDLSQMKTERQLKKESAARELEERRRSLARRPSAPPILHPEQLSPPLSRPVSRSDLLRSSTYPSPRDIPTRSQTVSPESQRLSPAYYGQSISRSQSTVHQRETSTPQIGLPATPKAMQHPKYDPEGKDIPDVPHIPESYTPIPQMSMGSLNEIAYNNAFENLAPLPKTTFAPLPKTTYQAAPRHLPPRSMSAPIPEEPMGSPRALPAALPTHPAFQAGLPPSNRRGTADYRQSNLPPARKINPGDAAPGTLGYEARNNFAVYSNNIMNMGGIDETIEASERDQNNLIPPPPPPPPAPPILRELQHLAQPPPPPPPPLYRGAYAAADTNSLVSGVSLGSQGSGVIEIVMDDDEEPSQTIQVQSLPQPSQSQNQQIPPPPPPPPASFRQSLQAQPPQGGNSSILGHSRGRSVNDNSITGRISRATERMRSASRGRNGASPQANRTRSPLDVSPYESVPPSQWGLGVDANGMVMLPGQRGMAQQQQQGGVVMERHPREIAAAMMEGGMI